VFRFTFFDIGLLMWIKNISPLDQVIKKSCDTVQQKWKKAGWAPQIHNQYLQSQAVVSPWSHFSIHCILIRSPRTSSKLPPMLLIWRWICFYPARPENRWDCFLPLEPFNLVTLLAVNQYSSALPMYMERGVAQLHSHSKS